MAPFCNVVASGAVNLSNTFVGACFNSPSSRFAQASPWAIVPGQHHARLTVTNASFGQLGVVISLYSSPSNLHADLSLTGTQTSGTVELDAASTDNVWSFCYEGPSVFGFSYEIDSTSASFDPPCVPPGGNCAYGTELKQPGTFIFYLTPALIDAWLTSVGAIWMAPLFTALYFTTFDASTLCNAGPPPLPVIDTSTLSSSISTVQQILRSIAWYNLCQCKNGSPPPVPFPIPNPPMPPGWPTFPTFNCNGADLCATLVAIQTSIAQLQAAVGEDLQLNTLVQRYSLPFAHIQGAVHSNLSGTGSFQISRLLGFEVVLTATPVGEKILAGNPNYLWDVGWMSVSEPDGLVEERRITRLQQTWFPRSMPLASTFGYFLKPGFTATFTELQAEP